MSVGPDDCPLSSMGIPGGGVVGGGGVDAGTPGVDGGPPAITGHFATTSFAYAGGTSLAGAPVADFEIEDALGVPTAISTDELLWVGFEQGALRGFDIATHEVEIDLDLTSITGTPNRINNLQVYRSDGRLVAIVAFGDGVARIEINATTHSFVNRGHFDSNFTLDARIHVVEPLRDEGFVVAVSAIPSRLWVIPRIDATGAFPPRTRPLDDVFMPRVVAPEAVADGFVWTGERNLCPRRVGDPACGHVGTSGTTCPSPGDSRCLEEVASATFDTEPVIGLGGPDQVATTGSLLIVGLNQPTVGVIASFDPVTPEIRDSFNLEGPISTFTTRSAGAEVYAFATTTAGIRSAELVAVIPTAPSGLEPRARRTLSNAEVFHDIAIGVEAFFPPPEPHEPIPLERTSAVVHLLVERP